MLKETGTKYECHCERSENLGMPKVISQESKDIMAAPVGKSRKSLRKIAFELEEKKKL